MVLDRAGRSTRTSTSSTARSSSRRASAICSRRACCRRARPPTSTARIVLERLPTFVGEDRSAASSTCVAAAPVPRGAAGRHPDRAAHAPAAGHRARDRRARPRRARRRRASSSCSARRSACHMAERIADPGRAVSRARRGASPRAVSTCASSRDTADELRRLVDDFNSMAATLQRAARRARAHEPARGVGRDGAAGRARDQEPAHADPALGRAPAARPRRPRATARRVSRPAASTRSSGRCACCGRSPPSSRALRATPTPHPADVVLGRAGGRRRRSLPRRHSAGRTSGSSPTLPDDCPAVCVDRTLLARALTNLIENALHAMPGGGTLRVSAAAPPGGGHVVLTLRDTGVGMDDAALARVFEPYFSTKTGRHGPRTADRAAQRRAERRHDHDHERGRTRHDGDHRSPRRPRTGRVRLDVLRYRRGRRRAALRHFVAASPTNAEHR